MKITRKTAGAILLLLLSIGVISSCEDNDVAPDASKVSTTPAIGGSAGVLWAVRTVTQVNLGGVNIGDPITIDVGTGFGAFLDGDNMVDVGTVTLNDLPLTRYSNNSYISTVSVTQPTGVDFSNGIRWAITGGNGYAAFDHTVTNSFPYAGTFTSSETLDRSENYTMSFSSISGADSIIFAINDLVKTVPGNTKSYTFTAAQLEKLSKGPGVIQAVPYNYKIVSYGGKYIAFGNQVSYSKTITIN
jgi:hypothetical protein